MGWWGCPHSRDESARRRSAWSAPYGRSLALERRRPSTGRSLTPFRAQQAVHHGVAERARDAEPVAQQALLGEAQLRSQFTGGAASVMRPWRQHDGTTI